MKKIIELINKSKTTAIIAMIHVSALPGTPKSILTIDEIVKKAKKEAKIYARAGVDALMIENMHDIPYIKNGVGPEITAAMTIVARGVKDAAPNIPCGIQILAGANKEALAAAKAAGLDFIRAEGFVYAHVADEGIIESCAGELLRYRKQIGAEDIAVFTDIKKKHSAHAITADTSIIETAHAAEFFLSDGVIVTGAATGAKTDPDEVRAVKKTLGIPVLVGSGVTAENVKNYVGIADGLIVGSFFKKTGHWDGEIDVEKIRGFMGKI